MRGLLMYGTTPRFCMLYELFGPLIAGCRCETFVTGKASFRIPSRATQFVVHQKVGRGWAQARAALVKLRDVCSNMLLCKREFNTGRQHCIFCLIVMQLSQSDSSFSSDIRLPSCSLHDWLQGGREVELPACACEPECDIVY